MKQKTTLRTFVFLLALSVIVSCSPRTELLILHTNDEHSHFKNLPKVAFLKDSLKAHHKNVILVSGGDHFTGNPYSDLYPDRGFPMVEMMNATGYDLAVLGNHSFDYGMQTLKKRMTQMNAPVICANADFDTINIEPIKPYEIMQFGKVKIAFLGLLALGHNGLPESLPSNTVGCKFEDGVKTAAKHTQLRKNNSALIGLSHLGFETDTVLANRYAEFDLIIGGHSHTVIDKPIIVNNALIVQTGNYVKNVGLVKLKFKGKKLVDKKMQLIPISSISGEKKYVADLREKFNHNEVLDEVLTRIEVPLDNKAKIGCVYTDAIRNETGFDIVFQNDGGIRLTTLPTGDLRVADIFSLDPFANEVYKYELTINEIESLITNATNNYGAIDLHSSGIKYSVAVDDKKQVTSLKITNYDGNSLDSTKKYTVGISSYVAQVYSFSGKESGKPTGKTTTEHLFNYLRKTKVINQISEPRVEYIFQ